MLTAVRAWPAAALERRLAADGNDSGAGGAGGEGEAAKARADGMPVRPGRPSEGGPRRRWAVVGGRGEGLASSEGVRQGERLESAGCATIAVSMAV